MRSKSSKRQSRTKESEIKLAAEKAFQRVTVERLLSQVAILGARAREADRNDRKRKRQKIDAGNRSGLKRSRGELYLRQAEELKRAGKAKHEVAGILATRHGVGAGAIRKAMNKAKKKSAT